MASQLVASQSALGWDSRLISFTDTNLRDNPLGLPLHTFVAGVDQYVNKSPRFDGLVSLSRDLIARPLRDELRNADVVHLHWINGVTTLREVGKAAPTAKIVWTLHDMNPFTGACHQSFGCQGFRTDCSKCPAVKRFAERSVVRSLENKTKSYSETKNLKVVSPSRWLQKLAAESKAMGELEISFIPNPVGDVFVSQKDDALTDSDTELSMSAPVFCLIATDLDDPLKNVAFAVESFALFRISQPGAQLVLVGSNGARFAEQDGVKLLGELGAAAIRHVIAQSCALLLTSLAENAPVVIAEAACVGTPTIGSAIPSVEEITTTLGHGGIAGSHEEMAQLMGRLAKSADSKAGLTDRRNLSTRARKIFGPETVAAQYLRIYEGDE